MGTVVQTLLFYCHEIRHLPKMTFRNLFLYVGTKAWYFFCLKCSLISLQVLLSFFLIPNERIGT